jgi:hypothetical protein
MKKLLITFLALFSCSALPTMPKQNIFASYFAYECEEINTDKLSLAELILSPKCETLILAQRKESFCWDLIRLYNKNKLTQESLLATVEEAQKINRHQTTNNLPVYKMHIGELLKEQKNNLIRENHLLVMPYNDKRTHNGILCTLYAALGIKVLSYDYKKNITALCAITAIALSPLAYICSAYLRTRENEATMNKIDKIINAIEAMINPIEVVE